MGSTYSLSFEATLQNHNSFMNLEKETVVNFQMDKKFPWNKNFGYLHQASSTTMVILSESTKKRLYSIIADSFTIVKRSLDACQ